MSDQHPAPESPELQPGEDANESPFSHPDAVRPAPKSDVPVERDSTIIFISPEA